MQGVFVDFNRILGAGSQIIEPNQYFCEDLNVFLELNAATAIQIILINDFQQILLLHVMAYRSEHVSKLFNVNFPIAILVKLVEKLSVSIDVVLGHVLQLRHVILIKLFLVLILHIQPVFMQISETR